MLIIKKLSGDGHCEERSDPSLVIAIPTQRVGRSNPVRSGQAPQSLLVMRLPRSPTGLARNDRNGIVGQFLFGLVFVLLTGLLGCKQEPAEKPYGGTLRLGGLGGPPSIINPVLTERTVSNALVSLIFNRLVRLNEEMLPEPDLAESWDISDDGLTYTFHLRQGVRFHDGVECTAEDVKFTYELITDPKIGSPWRDYFEPVKQWESTDKYTLKIMLREPFALPISAFTEHIAPRHLLKGRDIRSDSFNYQPIGTGPFRFKEWTSSDGHSDPFTSRHSEEAKRPKNLAQGDRNAVVLEANPDYYEGRPYLDRIIAIGYEDTSKFWGAFMRGEIDAIFFLSKEDFEIAQRDPDFRTYAFPSILTYGLEYNLEHPFFQDKKVRQAIGYGINVQEIINKVDGGYGMPSTGPFLPDSWSCNPEVEPLAYNPGLALELLKEAGWELNEKGILEKDGREFRFIMLVNTEIRNARMMAFLIYQELFRLGIRIDIKPFEYPKAKEEEYQDLIKQSGAYLTFFCGRVDPSELAHDWHSGFVRKQNKLYEYRNPVVEELFDQGRITREIEQRKKIYYRIHRIIYEDQPATFLYFFYHLGAIDARFQNTDGIFSTSMPFYTIKDWHIRRVDSSK